jgi:serine/threonine protein kinase/tetratricopeptide (TPR) repeat protein
MLTAGQFLTPRYRIVRRLKKGGMGAVYEAIDNILDATVAVKENCLEDPAMLTAFQREAQLLANLRHSSLPRCSDLLSDGEGQYIIMEFIEGDDLAAMMTERRTWLSNETVADLAWQMLDVLDYIHGESILHRDIKPANIKLKDGRAYLLDFGLAYGQSGEMDTVDVGEFKWEYCSKRYSPIEQSKCRRTSPASDLYSLGATLYYVLTNVKPIDAEERFESVSRSGRDPLEDINVYNPAADENLSRAIMQALALDADKRPQSASEMREMMFPQVDAGPQAGGVSRFLTARLLFEVVVLGVLASVVFFVLLPQRQGNTDIPSARDERPITPITPTPISVTEPSPSPAEEAARLADKAEHARHNGEDERAWSLLEQASALAENNPYIPYLVGDILWEAIVDNGEFSERIKEVQEQADQILRLVRSPRSAQEYVARAWANLVKATLGRKHPDSARLDQAIADANEVLTKYDPNSVAALTIRASTTFMKAGQKIDEQTTRRVLEDYDQAIRLAPRYAQAHVNLAEIYFVLGRRVNAPSRAEHLELARQHFEKAVELAPRAGFYTYLGDVYFEIQNLEKASENFGAAARVDPTYYQAYIGLGDSFFQKGCWEDARTHYLKANYLNQTSEKLRKYVFRKLGATYSNLKQFDLAKESYGCALKLTPNDPVVKKELERALVARNAGDR